jgi:hypothetical protein
MQATHLTSTENQPHALYFIRLSTPHWRGWTHCNELRKWRTRHDVVGWWMEWLQRRHGDLHLQEEEDYLLFGGCAVHAFYVSVMQVGCLRAIFGLGWYRGDWIISCMIWTTLHYDCYFYEPASERASISLLESFLL